MIVNEWLSDVSRRIGIGTNSNWTKSVKRGGWGITILVSETNMLDSCYNEESASAPYLVLQGFFFVGMRTVNL